MCGFAVYLGTDLEQGKSFTERANRLLAHRGPDDEGVFVGDYVVFGHRRLSIVDLSARAHQPMTSADGRWVIAYNGEVYNHLDLRSRLCKGWAFRTHSDTETVLAALALRGPGALEEMVGMWSLALWDTCEKRLFVSRDRYGQKPLYWRLCDDGSLGFASEIQPLLETGEHPAIYEPALAEFLATGNYGHLAERTFFRDVFEFPPAHWAWVSARDRRVSPVRYWRFPIAAEKERRPYDDTARRQFRSAFEEAVSSQLMSDVPVGATLSGGMDSSAVVGIVASKGTADPLSVFTAQAAGMRFDESSYVRAVEEKWPGRLDIHWVPLERMTLSEVLTEAIRTQEEPFGDPSIVAHGFLMDAAKKAGISVILGGQGGDELLFGYAYMGHALLASSLRRGKTRWALAEARALQLDRHSLLRIGLSAVLPGFERKVRSRLRLRRRGWLTPALRNGVMDNLPALAATSDRTSVWLETIERLALPHLTHYDDRSAMARSIEGRMPFLDHRLAEVVGSLDESAFLNGGHQKRILRESCGDLIPQLVLARRDKIGFFTPMREILRTELEWVRSLVTDDYAQTLNVFDVGEIKLHLDALLAGNDLGDSAHCVWRALSVRLWAECFAVSPMEGLRGASRR